MDRYDEHMESEHEYEILKQENEVLKNRIYKLIKEKDFIYSRLNQITVLLEEIRRV